MVDATSETPDPVQAFKREQYVLGHSQRCPTRHTETRHIRMAMKFAMLVALCAVVIVACAEAR